LISQYERPWSADGGCILSASGTILLLQALPACACNSPSRVFGNSEEKNHEKISQSNIGSGRIDHQKWDRLVHLLIEASDELNVAILLSRSRSPSNPAFWHRRHLTFFGVAFSAIRIFTHLGIQPSESEMKLDDSQQVYRICTYTMPSEAPKHGRKLPQSWSSARL
jgi:hypothetical protein